MMPYTSLDMLLAMHRALFGRAGALAEAEGKGPTSCARREPLPDPLGRALVALRPIGTVRAALLGSWRADGAARAGRPEPTAGGTGA